MISLTCRIKQINEQNKSKLIETENRLAVTRGDVCGGGIMGEGCHCLVMDGI